MQYTGSMQTCTQCSLYSQCGSISPPVCSACQVSGAPARWLPWHRPSAPSGRSLRSPHLVKQSAPIIMTAKHSSLSLRSKCFVSEWEGDTRMKDKKAQNIYRVCHYDNATRRVAWEIEWFHLRKAASACTSSWVSTLFWKYLSSPLSPRPLLYHRYLGKAWKGNAPASGTPPFRGHRRQNTGLE